MITFYYSQINPHVGHVEKNRDLMLADWRKAKEAGADLVIFPELAITGYPPEDLVLIPAFVDEAMRSLELLAEHTAEGPAVLCGGIWRQDGALYNAAFLLEQGRIVHRCEKHHLPNYGVFDELRVFTPGSLPQALSWRGLTLGVLVCEDLWHVEAVHHLASQSPDILISINASPYERDKMDMRLTLARAASVVCNCPLLYLNMVGGQDEVVFDGRSFVMDREGNVVQEMPVFQNATACLRVWEKSVSPDASHSVSRTVDVLHVLYLAMMTGLRDYVHKNGFTGVVIGLSGGIDSALTACVAVDALGAQNVHCVMLPSRFTADISVVDATMLATTLEVKYNILSITHGMEAASAMLGSIRDELTSLALENIQPRLRGMLLMAISNATGKILLTTGNKSEMATGYATLYGDMCGAFNVLKDVYKTEVYALSEWRNAHVPQGGLGPSGAAIPERIITRAPSAELKENQTDQDTLPPYAELDEILRGLIERRASVEEMIARGHAPETVMKVAKMLRNSEYKRRQAAPGVKLTSMSFGRDRRFPLTNGFLG